MRYSRRTSEMKEAHDNEWDRINKGRTKSRIMRELKKNRIMSVRMK